MNKKLIIGILITIIVLVAAGYFWLARDTKTIPDISITGEDPFGSPAKDKAQEDNNNQVEEDDPKEEPEGKGPIRPPVDPLPEGAGATINKDSLISSSGDVIISGTASGLDTLSLGITDMNGWHVVYGGPASIVDNRWEILIPKHLTDGVYHIVLFGPGEIGLATGVLVVGTITSDPEIYPTLVFVLQPSSVQVGQSTEIYWRAPNATSCVASGDWSGEKFILGTEETGPLYGEKSYFLLCTGAGGSVGKTVEIIPYQ